MSTVLHHVDTYGQEWCGKIYLTNGAAVTIVCAAMELGVISRHRGQGVYSCV